MPKYIFIIIFFSFVNKAFAFDGNEIKITQFDARVCSENEFNRFDIKLSLENTGSENINFKANTSRSGGLIFFPFQSDGEFCSDKGECHKKKHELASYMDYSLDVTVRPGGGFFYTDYFMIRMRSKNSRLKGMLHFELKGISDVDPKVSFKVHAQKMMEIESVNQCSTPEWK